MNFTDASAYAALKQSEKDGFDVVTLPAGSSLYRAIDPEESIPPTAATPARYPLFLGDYAMVINEYKPPPYGGSPRTVLKITTAAPMTLMRMTQKNLRALATGDDAAFVTKWYLSFREKLSPEFLGPVLGESHPLYTLATTKETPVIVPAGKDKSVRQGGDYANRDLARRVCARGFDGWIAAPDSILQYDPPTRMRGATISLYHPEVLLCPKPDALASVETLTGGSRLKTKKGRRARKATRRARTVRS